MKHDTTHSTRIKTIAIAAVLLVNLGTVSATPQLNAVSFDPGIVTAGDRVNISANIKETDYPEKNWDSDSELKAVLKPGNRLTREHVTIEEDRDSSIGFLYPEGVWNQRYQVKVDSGAPTGSYEFEIHVQYLEDGEPKKITTESGDHNFTIIRRFEMPVDREGVDLSADVKSTSPRTLRPGDDKAKTEIGISNTGNKPVEEIELRPETPEMIDPSFSADEKFLIDRLGVDGSSVKVLNLDLDEDLKPGVHTVNLSAEYEDRSGNIYGEKMKLPIRVEGRPDLELSGNPVRMKAGTSSSIRLNIVNEGEQDAESVTARILAERAQPFSLEDRSAYVGEIESGEEATAVLKLSSDRNAALKEHGVKVQLRSTGDSEEGDNSVYTFTREKQVDIEGRAQSSLVYIGLFLAVLTIAGAIYRYRKPSINFSGGEKDE